MSEIFADTFYFLALLSPSAKTSQRARSITAKQGSSPWSKNFPGLQHWERNLARPGWRSASTRPMPRRESGGRSGDSDALA